MDDKNIRTLTALRKLLTDEVFGHFVAMRTGGTDELTAEFLAAAADCSAEQDLCGYICRTILSSENAFSMCCAAGKEPSPCLKKAYLRDIGLILGYIEGYDGDFCGLAQKGSPLPIFDMSDGREALYERLKNFYARYGCGQFMQYRAFGYEDGQLVPVKNPSAVTLAQLKGYEEEKKAVETNIVSFLKGLPFGNMLLYGDRGTGKSSTVHAMLNKYWKDGLRIIELNKDNMLDLPKIRQKVTDNPLKFIIFIDDLSLNESDDKISGLKAALEGSVSGNTENTMIVATSNRRHIVKENFSDRENSVHVNDSLQEQLSLSDRFGITVLFSSTDKAHYVDIVKELLTDEGIEPDEKMLALAERWALVKGGRSPRRARQFVDLAVSCIKLGKEIEF